MIFDPTTAASPIALPSSSAAARIAASFAFSASVASRRARRFSATGFSAEASSCLWLLTIPRICFALLRRNVEFRTQREQATELTAHEHPQGSCFRHIVAQRRSGGKTSWSSAEGEYRGEQTYSNSSEFHDRLQIVLQNELKTVAHTTARQIASVAGAPMRLQPARGNLETPEKGDIIEDRGRR